MKKCFYPKCDNPGVEKYASVFSTATNEPVCPTHQQKDPRKPFADLSPFECSNLTDEDIKYYATESELGEELIKDQVADCRRILENLKPSGAPKEHAREILFKKIFEAMITADSCLSDDEVWKTAGRTVEHYRKQYGVQPLQKVGTSGG